MQRIWSEHVPYDVLADGKTLQLLAKFELEVVVAVTPQKLHRFGEVANELRRTGVAWALWPMLEDADGRWASCFNARRFVEFARTAADFSQASSVAIDLELPFHTVGKLLRADIGAIVDLVAVRRAWSRRHELARFARELEARGVHVTAAVTPLAVAGLRRARGWQKWLGAPIDHISADRVDLMLYSSLFEGYSAGRIDRDDARAILFASARLARGQFGAGAAVSLGVTGVGALGDERPYQSVAELTDDVAITRAAGISKLSLFDLSGVLNQPDPEAWLRAFTEPSERPSRPPMTKTSAVATYLPAAAGVCLRLL